MFQQDSPEENRIRPAVYEETAEEIRQRRERRLYGSLTTSPWEIDPKTGSVVDVIKATHS